MPLLPRFRRSVPAPLPASESHSVSLPQRWKRGRQRAALSALAVLTLFTGALHGQGGADQLDSWWLRARFSAREWLDNRFFTPKRDSRIVLVEMDDKTADAWSTDPFITWGGHMAKVIDQLNRSGARLIALDWTQPVATDTLLTKPNDRNDEQLGNSLHNAKNVVFVKFIKSGGGYVLPSISLLYSAPNAIAPDGTPDIEKVLGFAELPSFDNIISSFFPVTPPDIGGKREVSFAARVAQQSGFPLSQTSQSRSDGSLLINYADNAGITGENSPFMRASFYDLANAKTPDPRFKDKIVFIGVSFKGNNDVHFIPFSNGFLGLGSRKIAGVELQANAAATLLNGDALSEPEGIAVWLLSALLGAVGVAVYALWSWGRAARTAIGVALGWALFSFALFWGSHYALPLMLPLLSLVVGCGLMGGYRAFSEERERGQLLKIWGRHQDPRLIQHLLQHPEWRSGQGQEMLVTVLFADLKNFTKTVEPLSPQQALEALNRYLALFSQIIVEHGGIVDKYLGDGLMAQWGAPNARDDHATLGVCACLEIQKQVQQLTTELRAKGLVSFEARLTLHSGPVVAGLVGSDEQLEYTIIGDTVNVTSRLQETAKAMGCEFLISETTYEALQGGVNTGREAEVEIRGRVAPLRVFEVIEKNIHFACSYSDPSGTAKTSQNTWLS